MGQGGGGPDAEGLLRRDSERIPVRKVRKSGCFYNCGQMCFGGKQRTQQELLEMHMAETAMSSYTSQTEN